MEQALSIAAGQKQKLALSPARMLAVKLLEKSLPLLRAEIVAEMAENPAIEDLDHPLESSLSDVQRAAERDGKLSEGDYPEDDFTPGKSGDDEAAERRQAFFDNQVKRETLQEHLLAQLPLSGVKREDWPVMEILCGDLDDSGFYRGSAADVRMAFGKSEAEMEELFARLREFDPPGCGARNVRECLLAQLDALSGDPSAGTVRRLVENHLEELAAGRRAEIAAALGVTGEELTAAVAAMRTLSPRPGAAFPSERDRVEYVNPEVHTVRREGRWCAETDVRSLPEIRISPKFEALLADPAQSEEVKEYVRGRIERARELKEAVARRQRTVEDIAQAVYDRQQEFFTKGFPALKPMTETEIARAVGVDPATVSRTVRDKYADTPCGTVELRRFFTTGVQTGDGAVFTQEAALAALKAVVTEEDLAAPLSDERLAAALKAKGYPLARRTVAKYRERLGIPGASARRTKAAADML